jgi:hypothetical protein
MTAARIRAGLTAFCAADSNAAATGEALDVARELVRCGDGEPEADVLAVDSPLTAALAIGWATAPTASDRRRELIGAMTHEADDGRGPAAASAIAAMASYAAAKAPLFSVMAAGIEEAGPYGSGDLTSAALGSWRAPDGGVPADPLPKVAAVIAALRAGGDSPGGAVGAAEALGGDTADVRRLAGAIAAARTGTLNGIESSGDRAGELDDLAAALSELRS